MKNNVIFVTGISTGIGKTVVSAVLAEALRADYWKPIQAGLDSETDTQRVQSLVSNPATIFHEEAYQLSTPASPHLSARIDNIKISLDYIRERFEAYYRPDRALIIEGAGGLMVPVTETEFFPDLIRLLEVPVVVVSSQYLGNINHSLLTAHALQTKNIPVLGWVFNGNYMTIENDLLQWTPFPKLGRIEKEEEINKEVIKKYAAKLKPTLEKALSR